MDTKELNNVISQEELEKLAELAMQPIAGKPWYWGVELDEDGGGYWDAPTYDFDAQYYPDENDDRSVYVAGKVTATRYGRDSVTADVDIEEIGVCVDGAECCPADEVITNQFIELFGGLVDTAMHDSVMYY